MAKRCSDQSGRLLDDRARVAAADGGRRALEVADGLADGDVVRLPYLAAQFSVTDPEEHADALRSGERQIEASDARSSRRCAQ